MSVYDIKSRVRFASRELIRYRQCVVCLLHNKKQLAIINHTGGKVKNSLCLRDALKKIVTYVTLGGGLMGP